jgi:hypothetical protein
MQLNWMAQSRGSGKVVSMCQGKGYENENLGVYEYEPQEDGIFPELPHAGNTWR